MNHGTYVFVQLIRLVHRQSFARHADRYQGNLRVREFSCWHQFLCMSFGQLTHWESLRDLVTCLNAHQESFITWACPMVSNAQPWPMQMNPGATVFTETWA
jgi:hypothetical protein